MTNQQQQVGGGFLRRVDRENCCPLFRRWRVKNSQVEMKMLLKEKVK